MDQAVANFLDAVHPGPRQAEARLLVALFSEVSGYAPRLHGSMVGFGQYTYTYDSGHSGTSLATGFAPRKAELSLYILPGLEPFGPILARLGPHRIGKACLYLRRLAGVDQAVLRELIAAGLVDLRSCWTVTP